MTDTVIFSCGRILFPFDFWTDEFIAYNTVLPFAGPFMFHRKGTIIRTTGNPIFIY